MIELVWDNTNLDKSYNIFLYITSYYAWLASELSDNEEHHKLLINGIILAYDKGTYSSVILTDDVENEKKILKIIQQPPNEFKEKYVAHIVSQEPTPVEEISANDEIT